MEHAPTDPGQADDNPLQGFYDWQVATIMQARLLEHTLPPGDLDAYTQLRQEVEAEVRDFTLAVLPDEYRTDPNRDWPTELFMDITRVTLMRAAVHAGFLKAE